MAMKIFLKLVGVDGGMVAKGYEKWIEISSFSWGATQQGAVGGGGAGTGKLVVKTVDLSIPASIATPGMIKLLGTGAATVASIVTARVIKGTYYKEHFIKLDGVRVTSYSMSGQGPDASSTDTVSLAFLKLDLQTTFGKLTSSATLATGSTPA